jgi:hypothetical protein
MDKELIERTAKRLFRYWNKVLDGVTWKTLPESRRSFYRDWAKEYISAGYT